MANMQNKRGNFTSCSIASVTEAANIAIPNDTRASITNTDAINGYPISGFTWILAYQDQNFNSRSEIQAKATKDLLRWMISDGQRYATPLLFAPLPTKVAKLAHEVIDSITYSGKVL